MDVSELLNINLPSPLQPLPAVLSANLSASLSVNLSHRSCPNQYKLLIKRDDLIHPIISGNKWRKLQGIFEYWPTMSVSHIVSFGGGYSNHLHALGYACRQLNIPFTAMVRGNYTGNNQSNLTPMLKDLIKWKTTIQWLTKVDYKKKNDTRWLKTQLHDFQDCLVIPEGGSGKMVHTGMLQLVQELPEDLDYLLCPVGSGGTLAGIVQALNKLQRKTKVLGIAVLKGEGYLEDLVKELMDSEEVLIDKGELTNQNWHIVHDYHFGGYAKSKPELQEFMQNFHNGTNIDLEPVYSGKLMFALYHLLAQNFFKRGSKICAIHTGGLQGQRKIIKTRGS